jgi:predicted chitinase
LKMSQRYSIPRVLHPSIFETSEVLSKVKARSIGPKYHPHPPEQPKYGVDLPLILAHVMAQISHECGAGHDVVENPNYTVMERRQL